MESKSLNCIYEESLSSVSDTKFYLFGCNISLNDKEEIHLLDDRILI